MSSVGGTTRRKGWYPPRLPDPAVLLALFACAPPLADTAADSAADTAADAPAVTVDYVATAFTVAPAGAGFDLDGDGAPDNALADLGPAIDPLVAERLATNVHVVLVQLADVNDWRDDPAVRVGMFSAVDLDHDGTDNTSGAEAFDATGFVDDAGRAIEGFDAAIAAGRYSAVVETDTFQVGSFVFGIVTGVRVVADLTADTQTGLVGIGVTQDALTSALTDEGVDSAVIGLLTERADLDLDGDGAPETVSMAFEFSASRCALGD